MKLEFYRGIKEIAGFLGLHPDTVARRLRQGLIPAKRDPLGRWVLSNLDYYQSLKRMSETQQPEQEVKVCAGVKWGLLEPTVILVAAYYPPPADRIHLARELYRKELYLEEFLEIAQWREEIGIRKFFCDPSEPEFVAKMRRARLPATAAPKEQDLARNLVKQRLANTREGKPGGLTVSRECVNTIPEFQKYHMPEGKTRPADVDTHGIKALHFLVLGLSLEAIPKVRWL